MCCAVAYRQRYTVKVVMNDMDPTFVAVFDLCSIYV